MAVSDRRKQRYETQKSLQQRFLFVLHLFIALTFLAFGLFLIFYTSIQLTITNDGRKWLGIVFIVYSFIRGFRAFQKLNEIRRD